MNEQTQDDHPLEEGSPDTETPAPADQPSDLRSTRKIKFTWEFVVGFLGWYLVTALFYGQVRDAESLMICGGLLFPVNLIVLILLLKKLPQAGWGMLAAVAVNMIVSLALGLVQNAFCFIPFFGGAK